MGIDGVEKRNVKGEAGRDAQPFLFMMRSNDKLEKFLRIYAKIFRALLAIGIKTWYVNAGLKQLLCG